MVVSAVGTTRKACPAAEMALESRYLRQLQAVTRYEFIDHRLALSYTVDGKSGVMLFERAAGRNDAIDSAPPQSARRSS
jgi:heat shock protein HslJ